MCCWYDNSTTHHCSDIETKSITKRYSARDPVKSVLPGCTLFFVTDHNKCHTMMWFFSDDKKLDGKRMNTSSSFNLFISYWMMRQILLWRVSIRTNSASLPRFWGSFSIASHSLVSVYAEESNHLLAVRTDMQVTKVKYQTRAIRIFTSR